MVLFVIVIGFISRKKNHGPQSFCECEPVRLIFRLWLFASIHLSLSLSHPLLFSYNSKFGDFSIVNGFLRSGTFSYATRNEIDTWPIQMKRRQTKRKTRSIEWCNSTAMNQSISHRWQSKHPNFPTNSRAIEGCCVVLILDGFSSLWFLLLLWSTFAPNSMDSSNLEMLNRRGGHSQICTIRSRLTKCEEWEKFLEFKETILWRDNKKNRQSIQVSRAYVDLSTNKKTKNKTDW